ncbi:50S ribosomal protein L13 [Candidatus Annandia pinicola]|uniref:50S ribosomal protein L13 n=1 Tax=Candidatus Annandia pinicola TaxID=1345117 RepID=UPI001D019B75|nr:50S ribosomal protein L13 [Candidatus Annandia pinicola]UDG80277.1 50S ribosomal protein L13 [Candidatus Annandia pinicola]
MKTFTIKKKSIIKKWYIVNAKNKILGRFVSKISKYLMGKNKPIYTPHIDTGDNIIVINASKILLTGNKINSKQYYYHTGYPGGIKKVSLKKMLKKYPIKVIQKAIKGMLPKGPLGKQMFSKLRIYPEEKYEHKSQKTKLLNL